MPTDRWLTFYAGVFHASYPEQTVRPWRAPAGLPDGAYIYDTKHKEWLLSDFTPVLPNDVPKELKLWVLILT